MFISFYKTPKVAPEPAHNWPLDQYRHNRQGKNDGSMLSALHVSVSVVVRVRGCVCVYWHGCVCVCVLEPESEIEASATKDSPFQGWKWLSNKPIGALKMTVTNCNTVEN